MRARCEDVEWEANLCLTAFDILWAYVPSDVLAEVEAQLSDDEREVLQRAADKSVIRRILGAT
jgi:hypothetical protein